MKNKAIHVVRVGLVLTLAWLAGYSPALGQEGQEGAPRKPDSAVTGFTYQGSLKKNGSPVNTTCDFEFGLWTAQSLGSQIGVTQTMTSTVSAGLFSVQLNETGEFTSTPFDGSERWLAAAVRCPTGAGSYTSLAPQELNSAPSALYSLNAGSAAGLQGVPVSSTAPSTDQVLAFDGLQWEATSLATGVSGVTASAPLSSSGGETPDISFTGVLPLANGGTGSATQNFVDLSSAQTIGGDKTFSNVVAADISGNAATATTASLFSGALSGDVTGGQSGTVVTGLQQVPVASVPPSSGEVLKFDGSQWTPGNTYTPSTFYYPLLQPQTVDLKAALSEYSGFLGGFSDGRYAYFVPSYHGHWSGYAARLDLQNFTTGGVVILDLTAKDSEFTGFSGGFTDGRYGYYVPCYHDYWSGKVARADLQNFVAAGVTGLDLTAKDSGLKGFVGGFTDGRYGYFVPFQNSLSGFSGLMARVDLQDFTLAGTTKLDLAAVNPALVGFQGGFTDGRYGYLVPYINSVVARLDLQNFNTGGVAALDLAAVDSRLKGFEGGFTDGRYGYFVPHHNGDWSGLVARVDLKNFTAQGVTMLDLTAVDSDLKGFWGGFTDGRYGYFVPHNNGNYFGKLARVDLLNFTTSGVTSVNLAALDPNLVGFRTSFSDGRYGYLVANYNGSTYLGKVARIPLFFGGGTP